MTSKCCKSYKKSCSQSNGCESEKPCCSSSRKKCCPKNTVSICACAHNGIIDEKGVELKLESRENATYKWTVCPPSADKSLENVNGQNCIVRHPLLVCLDEDTSMYDEIVYTGYIVVSKEVVHQVCFSVKVFELTNPCDYCIEPSNCVLENSGKTDFTIEYCGSNCGFFDPTAYETVSCVDTVGFSDSIHWSLNGHSLTNVLPNTFETVCVTKTCGTNTKYNHNVIVVHAANIAFIDGRNKLTFTNPIFGLTLSFYFVKCF